VNAISLLGGEGNGIKTHGEPRAGFLSVRIIRILLKTRPFQAYIGGWNLHPENAGSGSPTMGLGLGVGSANWAGKRSRNALNVPWSALGLGASVFMELEERMLVCMLLPKQLMLSSTEVLPLSAFTLQSIPLFHLQFEFSLQRRCPKNSMPGSQPRENFTSIG
jgi:hypothetical protein